MMDNFSLNAETVPAEANTPKKQNNILIIVLLFAIAIIAILAAYFYWSSGRPALVIKMEQNHHSTTTDEMRRSELNALNQAAALPSNTLDATASGTVVKSIPIVTPKPVAPSKKQEIINNLNNQVHTQSADAKTTAPVPATNKQQLFDLLNKK